MWSNSKGGLLSSVFWGKKSRSIPFKADQGTSANRLSAQAILSIRTLNGQPLSKLEKLPQELLLQITNYLAVESQACLAICSRNIAKRLGIEYLLALRMKGEHLQCVNGSGPRLREGLSLLSTPLVAYLRLLDRDRPDLFYCQDCICLHSVDGVGMSGPNQSPGVRPRSGSVTFPSQAIWSEAGLSYFFHFHHLQLAMARQRYYGLPDGRIETFSHSVKQTSFPGYPYQTLDKEARCVGDHLILRTQHVLQIGYNSIRLASEGFSDLGCKHYLLEEDNYEKIPYVRKALFECPNRHDTLGSGACICKFQPSCAYCPTEMSLDKVRIGPDLLLVAVTQWKDFGEAVTPEDRIWKAHSTRLGRSYQEFPGFLNWEWEKPEWGLANIRKRFEEQPGTTVEQLTLANMSYLESEKYFKVMNEKFRPLKEVLADREKDERRQ